MAEARPPQLGLLNEADANATRLLNDLIAQRKSLDSPNRSLEPDAQASGRQSLDRVIAAVRRTLDSISDTSSSQGPS